MVIGAFYYCQQTDSDLGYDVTSTLQAFWYVLRVRVGEKHGRHPESCCYVALAEYQALHVLHLVTSLPSVSNASHVSNTRLKQGFIQYCTHNKTDSHTHRQ